jgi:hypothetical protein
VVFVFGVKATKAEVLDTSKTLSIGSMQIWTYFWGKPGKTMLRVLLFLGKDTEVSHLCPRQEETSGVELPLKQTREKDSGMTHLSYRDITLPPSNEKV